MLLSGLQNNRQGPSNPPRNLRAQSQDRILGAGKNDLGLSTRSALNDRYFESGNAGSRYGHKFGFQKSYVTPLTELIIFQNSNHLIL